MANPEHLAILKKGVKAWNGWRDEHPTITPDLSEADLREADLSGAYLGEADLTEAKLVRTNLRGASLNWANLNWADLSVADLTYAQLGRADLSETNMEAADLSKSLLPSARLIRANLSRANFTGAKVFETLFTALDLSCVTGLETITHYGPSFIDIETIYRSHGNIPEVFLRGAGVPANFINYVRSLVGKAIEFYSCFISYSTKDQKFADRLYADLQAKGVRCWFAPHHVAGGKKLHEQIDEAIRMHERLLLILSPASMQSEWVKTEIAKARKRELRERRRILFPVRLVDFESLRDWECFDADTGKDSAREIREYFIPDFSNWKNHDSYQQAFGRLLRDLKTCEDRTGGS